MVWLGPLSREPWNPRLSKQVLPSCPTPFRQALRGCVLVFTFPLVVGLFALGLTCFAMWTVSVEPEAPVIEMEVVEELDGPVSCPVRVIRESGVLCVEYEAYFGSGNANYGDVTNSHVINGSITLTRSEAP